MSDEYTPSMDEVRTAYKAGGGYRWPERGEQFDRAMAAHDRALREQIADDLRIEALNEDPEIPDPYREGIRDGLMRGVDIARGEEQTDE